MSDVHIRADRPDDHPRIRAVCDDWWGRPVGGVLPRLFLDHFHDTSLVVERGEGRSVVWAINERSIAFHWARVGPHADYEGPGVGLGAYHPANRTKG